MVTEISGAVLNQSVVSQVGTAVAQRGVEAVRPDNPEVSSQGAARDQRASSSSHVAGAYAQLRVRQDALNKAASVVRDVGNAVVKADELLSGMEDELGRVVKMYPPYPVDNPERIALLNNFSGLRRQIDALTFPPPETLDAVSRLLGAQEEKGADAEVAGESPSIARAIKEPMWDILTLDPEAASDEAVGKALDQVKAMKSVLENLQAGMWQDVVSFVKQAESPETQYEAAGIREQLAGLGDLGIGSNARQLEQAAESK